MLNKRSSNDTTDLEWTQIACGAKHTVALTKNGEVFTWGYNDDSGQLGHADGKSRTAVPTKVASLTGLVITQIACGYNHTAALTCKGELLTWCVLLILSDSCLSQFQ